MRVVLTDQVWIGNAFDLRDVPSVLRMGIEAIVDIAANEPAVQYPRDIVYCRVPLIDGSGNDCGLLRLAVHVTVELVRARIPVMVACSAGMSRSPAIVAAALSILDSEPADEVLQRISRNAPHDVSPAFWNDIRQILAPEAITRN